MATYRKQGGCRSFWSRVQSGSPGVTLRWPVGAQGDQSGAGKDHTLGEGGGRVDEGWCERFGVRGRSTQNSCRRGQILCLKIMAIDCGGVESNETHPKGCKKQAVALREDRERPAAPSQKSDHWFIPMDLWYQGGELGD